MFSKISISLLMTLITLDLEIGGIDSVAAEPIQINYQAIVNGIYDPYYWLAGVATGDTIRGWYSYDSDSADIDPIPERGVYEFYTTPSSLISHVSDFVFQTDTTNVCIQFILGDSLTDDKGQSYDLYEFSSFNNVESTHGYMYMGIMRIRLRDNSKTALSSDSMPLAPPHLADWQDLNQLFIAEQSNIWKIWAYLDSVWSDPLSGIREPLPSRSLTLRNYPNPFSSSTTIEYILNQAFSATLLICDILGHQVAQFDVPQGSQGLNTIIWNGLNNEGQRVPSGLYIYRLEAGGLSQTRKMLLLR